MLNLQHLFISLHLHTLTYVIPILMTCIWLQAIMFPFNVLAVVISIFAPILIALYLYKQSRTLQQHLLFIMIALCIAIVQINKQLQLQIPSQYIAQHRSVNMRATVNDIAHIDNNRYHYKIMITTSAISPSDETTWRSCSYAIVLYSIKDPALRIGDEIEMRNIMLKVPPAQQSYALYLLKEGISATSFIHHLEYTLINCPTYHVQRFFYEWRETIYARLQQKNGAFMFCALFFIVFR